LNINNLNSFVYIYISMTSLNGRNGTKINQLLKIWPYATVATQSWLDKQGIYRQLSDSYCRHNWITRIDSGIYVRSSEDVDWSGALYAIQKQLGIKIHLAAESALSIVGAGQNIPLGQGSALWFFVDHSEAKRVPDWFEKHFASNYSIKIKYTSLFSEDHGLGLRQENIRDYDITISSNERAIMECLYLAPKAFSLEHASKLMESMRMLRPEVCQQLLMHCSSIKVKRLFLYLAELHNHNWVKLIDQSKIDLGSGKRQITPNGKYVAKYKLVIACLNKHEGYDNV